MSELEKIPLKDLLSVITVTQAITLLTVFSGLCFFIFSVGEHWGKINEKETKVALIEDKKRIIHEHDNKWSKLEPHLALKSQFDLRKNVIHSYSRDIPKNTRFLQNEIYADTAIEGLKYEYEEHTSYFSDMFDLQFCGEHLDNLAKSHSWYSDKPYSFDPSFELSDSIIPAISLQRINKFRLGNKIVKYFECLLDNASKDIKQASKIIEKESELTKVDKNDSNGTEFLEKILEVAQDLENRDLISIFHSLLNIINFSVTLAIPDLRWESSQVQKDGRALYATHIYSYRNAPWINKKQEIVHSDLSIHAQFIIIESFQHIYFIQIISPSLEGPFNRNFQALVGKWVSTLRLVEN